MYSNKRCVHISAHQESFSDTKSERSLSYLEYKCLNSYYFVPVPGHKGSGTKCELSPKYHLVPEDTVREIWCECLVKRRVVHMRIVLGHHAWSGTNCEHSLKALS